jgi:hypothetical protein
MPELKHAIALTKPAQSVDSRTKARCSTDETRARPCTQVCGGER